MQLRLGGVLPFRWLETADDVPYESWSRADSTALTPPNAADSYSEVTDFAGFRHALAIGDRRYERNPVVAARTVSIQSISPSCNMVKPGRAAAVNCPRLHHAANHTNATRRAVMTHATH